MPEPFVSILIAFRNEESNIPNILRSIKLLDFPADNFEILLGNDNSTDTTSELLHAFSAQETNVSVFDIPESTKDEVQKGKARVLAILAKEAKGNYLLFTDADVVLPVTWIKTMITPFTENKNMGVVVGISGMRPETLKMAMQSMEWLTVLYILYLLSKVNFPGTGMGNNMAVSRRAYEAIGGYEALPFSIVEDYALFKAVIDNGFDFQQLFEKDCLAYTVPPDKFLVQRKRWLKGGIQSASFLLFPALIQTLWIPVLLLLSLTYPSLVWPLFALQIILLSVLVIFWTKKITQTHLLKYLPLFVFYLPLSWFLIGIYTLLPGKIKWKGREY